MTLFAKILGWFVAAVLITVLATTLTSILSYKPSSRVRAPFSLMIAIEGGEARHAWETGGRAELAATLDRFRTITHAYGVAFTDLNGVDLATGEPHPELMERARRHPIFLMDGGRRLVVSRFSSDGHYCFFLILSPVLLALSNWQPAHFAVVGVVLLLCYALTRYLTSPLRSLQGAVEKFGRGEMAARAPEARHDELGELSRSFNRMAERLERLVTAQRRLLLDISHELRSPLARLSVAIELARSNASEPPLDRIQQEADRMNELIGQMLEVARLEAAPAERKFETVRLNQLLETLVESCSIEAQARRCELTLACQADVSVEGNRELLRRAIENVVRNAIRFAPPRTRIEVGLENGGERARLKVRDYGPGVPEASLPRIFDPFYRVEEHRGRATGGSGLGLAIALRAVELHRGTLRASNALPGLLIEIELPVT